MATLAARAIRGATAQAELSKELAELSKVFDIEIPPEAPRSPDPEMQPILEMERQIELVRALRVAAPRAAAKREGFGYESLTVPLLREEAERRELEIPPGARKDDLIQLLQDDDDAR